MSSNVPDAYIDINDHGLLLIKGPDAIKFLQGQVTCDIEQLAIDNALSQTCLGAHCTHKGRMLFSFRASALAEDTIALCLYKELIPSALEALKKYSVFSKVELIDANKQYQVIGLICNDSAKLSNLIPQLPTENDSATHNKGAVFIRISDHRYECWIPSESESVLTELKLNKLEDSAWSALNIADGIGEVRPETVEEFIPQMLNLQVLSNGISFNKGCYTGQEVVARMQYLGKLKRRMHRFKTGSAEQIIPGMPLFTPDSSQVVGHVVISETTDSGQELLAVVTEEAVKLDKVHLDNDCQHKLHALPLPYAINKE